MNLTNTTIAEPHDLFLSQDMDNGYFVETMVGIIPKKSYLGVIYFILAFGLLGNACIIALMQDREFRNLSYSVYLRVLAVSDSLLLAAVGTEDILDHQYYRLDEFQTSSEALCKIWQYVAQALRVISPWLVVSLTFDRFVAVVFPLKRSEFCSRRTASIVCSVVMGVTFAETLFFPLLAKVVDGECAMPDWESVRNYASFRSLALETTIPCVLILFLNVYIIIVIDRSRRFRAAAAAAGSRQPGQEKTTRVDAATVSLMAVSVMAFVTLVPISLLQVVEWAIENQLARLEARMDRNNTEHVQTYQSTENMLYDVGNYWPVLNLVYLFNFGHNFYIMLVSGAKYRNKVGSWFKCLSFLRRKQSSTNRVTNRDTEPSKF
ncbi:growth hormone secretagogue receptor type 1 [Elysia marginata]|uniref:Growth hormone secretagogue receptor type 1 n=1 Tax=Elysia marginata TaxID=1093978 RepID=A0AAV4GY97_9GAST|nr:growth hormone secretagogue receptor type 1 [Elysia marginata]